MKKVLVSILAAVVNLITLPVQALALIGLKKRLKKADENLKEETDIIGEMCEGRILRYDQYIDLKKILINHYRSIYEGPTKMWFKWTDWVVKYVPSAKEYMYVNYHAPLDEMASAELLNVVTVSC